VARVELLDAAALRAVNAYSKTSFAEAPTLFFEFVGTHAGVKARGAGRGGGAPAASLRAPRAARRLRVGRPLLGAVARLGKR
jgi:hypothetical protein